MESITSNQETRIQQICVDVIGNIIKKVVQNVLHGLNSGGHHLSKADAQAIIVSPEWRKALFDVLGPALYAVFCQLGSERYLGQEYHYHNGADQPCYPHYPEGYARKQVAEQIAIWLKHFPSLNADAVLARLNSLPELPLGAEGWFVIPNPDRLARSYGQSLELVHAAITNGRKFELAHNAGSLADIVPTRHLSYVWTQLSVQQPGDFIIIGAQFGDRHKGKSIGRASACCEHGEFCLGPFEVASMLLTHPERLVNAALTLNIDCPGARQARQEGPRIPYYEVKGDHTHEGTLQMGTMMPFGKGTEYESTPTGFLPQ